MGFYFNGYDKNGSPLTYNTNYINIIESWWNNANILNGTLTISPNILNGSSYTAFILANAGGYDTLEALNLSLINLTANDFKSLPQFVVASGVSNNLKNFSYSINNIENGDFCNLRYEAFKDIIEGSWCPNLSNNGLLNIINFMDEIYSKTNIPSWPNQMFRESSLSDIICKNFTYDEGITHYLDHAFQGAKVVNLNFENFKAYSNPYIDLSYLFYNCQNLQMGSLNENFFSILDNTHSNNVIMHNAFGYCYNLTEIPNLYNVVITNAYYAFMNTGLTAFPKYTFSNCDGFKMLEYTNLIEISNLKYTNANFTNMGGMFGYCHNLKKIDNISIKNVSDLSSLFYYDKNLSQINNLTIEGTDSLTWGFSASGVKIIDNLFLSNISNAYKCFEGASLLTFTNSVISQVINMDNFFNLCVGLKTLPNFDFSKTTSANNMFLHCVNLSTDSLNYFGMVLPNRSNLTNISTYNLSYFGLTNDQINVIASNTAARISVQSKGWEIANLEPKRTRVTQFAQMNNNYLEKVKIGMDAEYITLPGGILNFLPDETNIPTVISEMYNYLNDQINAKYRAFDISFDIYDIGDYNESTGSRQYIYNQHINTRIYFDTSENGENLRNYIEQYTGYSRDNPYYVGNLNIIEISAPNFINAYNMFFGEEIG